jgi:hypothetical protein
VGSESRSLDSLLTIPYSRTKPSKASEQEVTLTP